MQLSYSRKVIFNAASIRHLNLRISDFLVVSVACGKICVRILSFVKFGQVAAEIWRYNDFRNGGRPPCWIFEIEHFHHLTVMCVRLCLLIPILVLIGQYGAEL